MNNNTVDTDSKLKDMKYCVKSLTMRDKNPAGEKKEKRKRGIIFLTYSSLILVVAAFISIASNVDVFKLQLQACEFSIFSFISH